jgi:hypothetical protein
LPSNPQIAAATARIAEATDLRSSVRCSGILTVIGCYGYVGRYQLRPDLFVNVSSEGDSLAVGTETGTRLDNNYLRPRFIPAAEWGLQISRPHDSWTGYR